MKKHKSQARGSEQPPGRQHTTEGIMVSAVSQANAMMRAIRIHGRGGPERLVYEDVSRPTLSPGDALVRVCAVGISPAEFTWRILTTPDGRDRLRSSPATSSPGSSRRSAPVRPR